jgi:hypothetical protein
MPTTTTDSPELSIYSPPAEPDQLTDWLDGHVERVAADTTRALRDLLEAAVARWADTATLTAAGLLAAGDAGALGSIRHDWAAVVKDNLSKELGGLYLGGAQGTFIKAAPPVGAAGNWLQIVNDRAVSYMSTATNRLTGVGERAWQGMRSTLTTAVEKGWDVDRTNRELTQQVAMSSFRGEMIARTEVMGAYNSGTRLGGEALGAYGPLEHSWLATGDNRTRESHAEADGQTIPFDQPFTVGGASLLYPGDSSGPPEEVVNCRCVEQQLFAGDTRPDGTLVEPEGVPLPPPEPLALPEGFAAPGEAPLSTQDLAPPIGATPKSKAITGFSDDDIGAWIKSRLDLNPKATASKLIEEWKASGRGVNDKRFRQIMEEVKKGGTGKRLPPSLTPNGVTGPRGMAGVERSTARTADWARWDHPMAKGEQYVESFRAYTGSTYSTVNRVLRSRVTIINDTPIGKIINGIRAGMKPLKSDVEVYRGVQGMLSLLPRVSDPTQLIGTIFRDPAFLSTSGGASQGPAFGGDVVFRIRANAGTPARWVQPISSHSSERELLLGDNVPMYVHSVRRVTAEEKAWGKVYGSDGWVIEVETVSEDFAKSFGKVWNTGSKSYEG